MTLEPKPTAFAVLDILGYGQLMRQHPRDVFALVQELLASSTRNWPVQRDLDRHAHFSGGETPPELKYLQFSDTLLIWLSSEPAGLLQSPAQLVRTVSYATSLTLGAFLGAGVPLRGSIGFGPAFISYEPLFFTGWELYKTMKAERAQAWAGAALHETAVTALSDPREGEPFIVGYPVPMSDPAAAAANFAVDWVTPLCLEQPLTPPWEQMFRSNPPDARLRGNVMKRENSSRRLSRCVGHFRCA